MIKAILSNPIQGRVWNGVPGHVPARREIEVLVQLEDDSECTIWIPEQEAQEFYSSHPHGKQE